MIRDAISANHYGLLILRLAYLRFMDAESLAAHAIDAVLISGERIGQDSLAEADTIIRSANERLQARAFPVRETNELVAPITFSAGVVMVEGTAMDAAIAVADALLYRAEADGRNRIVCEEAPTAGLNP